MIVPHGILVTSRGGAGDGARTSSLPLSHASERLVTTLRDAGPALDEEQVPEREFDGLLLARSNQEPCVSGANRV
jgi:hypothetical protein